MDSLTSNTRIAQSCCTLVIFNLDTGLGRVFFDKDKADFMEAVGKRMREGLLQAGYTGREDAPDDVALGLLAGFLGDLIPQAPQDTQTIANLILGKLGKGPVNLADLPIPLRTNDDKLLYLATLIEYEHRQHMMAKQGIGRSLLEAIVAAAATGEPTETEDGTVVAPMAVIPLKEDGTPDMERLHEYAPGTKAYKEVVKNVTEPNRVPGNGTIH